MTRRGVRMGAILALALAHGFAFAHADVAPSSFLPAWNEIGSGRLIFGEYHSAGGDRFGHVEQRSLTGVLDLNSPRDHIYGVKSSLLGLARSRSVQYGETTKIQGRVRDLYAYVAPAGWDIRLGQMILPWGKTDAVNPTDFLSAKDYRFYISDGELQRLGATAAHVAFTPNEGNSPLQIAAVYQSRFPQTQLLLPRERVPTGVSFGTAENPAQFSGNEEGALKVSYLGSGFDASISGFRGRNHFPQYVLRDLREIRQEFTRQTAIGADFSKTLQTLILRGEVAYTVNEGDARGEGGTALTQPNHLDVVAGAERAFGAHFRVITQLLWRYHPKFARPEQTTFFIPAIQEGLRQLGQANALIQNYQHRSRPGGTVFVSYFDEDAGWTADVSLIGNFVGGDFLVRPRATYDLWTNFKGSVGGTFYGGPKDQPLGSLRGYSQLFTELAYAF